MATIKRSLDELMTLDGALCAALVDASSGMLLGSAGGGMNLDLAAAGDTEVIRAKLNTMRMMAMDDVIEDMLITLGRQYHIIRPLARRDGVFLYCVFDKARSNLALARRKAGDVEKQLEI